MSLRTRIRCVAVACFTLGALLWQVRDAAAQSVGIGPRLSFVRGDVSSTPSTRFFGGTLRIRTSKRVVLEAALDYRAKLSEDGRTRFREIPIQGSLLLFPFRSMIAPYVLVGFGAYSEHTDALDLGGQVEETTATRQTGAHFGFGGELFFGRRAALFLDYRYRFVRFGGEPEPGSEPVDIPGLDRLKLSHRGSMWTSGMAFYF